MKEKEKHKINFNMDYLAQNTMNLLMLKNMFRGLIIPETWETIISNREPYKQNTAFYEALLKIGDNDPDIFKNLLRNLEKSGNLQIARVLRQDLDEQPSEPKKEFLFDINSPIQPFLGRDTEMQIIKSHWDDFSSDFGVVVITGETGVGKTELTYKFAQYFLVEKEGNCILINAENSQTVFDSLRRVAVKLNITIEYDNGGVEKPVKLLLRHICSKLANSKTVIIFDHLDGYANTLMPILDDCVFDYVEGKCPRRKPFILITSRNENVLDNIWKEESYIQKIKLPKKLDEKSAIEFVQTFLTANKHDTSKITEDLISKIKDLCEELYFWPLALQLAVSFINKNRYNNSDVSKDIQRYMKSLDGYKKQRNPHLSNTDEYFQLTYFQWKVSQSRIKSQSKALKMMNLVSLFKSENLHLTFVTNVMTALADSKSEKFKIFTPDCIRANTNSYNSCFATLREYAMLQSLTVVDEEMLSMQRELQSVILADLKKENELNALINAVVKILPQILNKVNDLQNSISENEKNCILTLDNMIHIEMIWKHAVEINQFIVSSDLNKLANQLAKTYYYNNRYTNSVRFCQISYEKKLPQNAQFNVSMKQNEVEALIKLANYKTALERVNEIIAEQNEFHKGNQCQTLCQMCKQTARIKKRLDEACLLE